jgi:hypothetical protein
MLLDEAREIIGPIAEPIDRRPQAVLLSWRGEE